MNDTSIRELVVGAPDQKPGGGLPEDDRLDEVGLPEGRSEEPAAPI
jgi:hypothetical protein